MRLHTPLMLSLILFPVFVLAQPKCDSKEIKMFFGKGPFMEKEVIEINAAIKKQKPSNLLAVLALYFPLDVENEGFEEIKMTQKKLENGNTGVFYVHHNLPDDALKAVKVFLELERQHQYNWKVVSIKTRCQCWRSEKADEWGISDCP